MTQEHASKLEQEILKQGGVPDGFESVDIEFFRFKEHGDKVTGILLNKKPFQMGKGNMTKKYYVKLGNGREISFLGNTQLDEKLDRVAAGAVIFIEYIGDIPIEGSTTPMKDFKVAIKTAR